MNFSSKINTGDIFIERRLNWYMSFAAFIFPKTMLQWPNENKPERLSMHNGVFGTFNGKEGVFESERHGIGFRFIEWEKLNSRIVSKKSQFKALRYPSLTNEQRITINLFLSTKVGHIKYDYGLFMRLVIDGLLRKPVFKANNPEKWVCTEVISESYKIVGIDLLKDDLPSPYAIEKLVVNGVLVELADFY